MRNQLITAFLLTFFFLPGCTTKTHDIKVITLNIRYDNPADSTNAWPHRAHIVSSFIDSEKPDLFGMQEVLWHQYEYLDSALTGYASVAAGRDDGRHAGEASPVFYRRDRFEAYASGTFWLSATPEVPGSKGWGAACTRIATWVRLTDKQNGDTILFMNTHFDHISDSARVMAAIMMRQRLEKLARDNRFVITGDFNALPGSLAINKMVSDGLIKDSYSISQTAPDGSNSFNSFKNGPRTERIDYIFVRNGMGVKNWSVKKVKDNGVFISDHWPVIATIMPGR
jgi:endonuclease/exonuclease/phosphatase family metal-dependent hydrolase